jgi:DNA (cytosine-5)-methyltransferase 1
MSAYYNEIDPYCAAWLQNLMDAGHIAPGVIDTRSIEDVTPNDLCGFIQCHFFAGLGGWAYALDLAGWPRDRPVWTGSCPCQPFSAAGKGAGFADERHLWPAWQHLIAQCRPAVVFGEQVAKAAEWLRVVSSDLEGMGYAVGCRPIEAASAGGEDFRDRLYFVADCIQDGFHGSWLSQEQRPCLSRAPRSFDGFPWAALPMPANAADFGSVLLLPDGTPDELASIAAYGNAINAQAAQAFIESYCEARGLILSDLEAAA